MKDLAESVAAKRTFELSEDDPIVETIEVYVNGQVANTDDWEYDETENYVVFAQGTEPEVGHTIDIEYATWGCD